MPRLPYELNRPIFESLGRKELFKVVTVSRHFQFEGERLIYRDISLRSNSYQVRSDLRDLYGTRRFHHYIQSLLLESVDEDVETEMGLPPVFSYELASLLEKLTALVFLSISFVRDGIYDWNFCGNVFRHCKFRRRRFRCDLALDSDLQAFLAKQPEITEWIWSPKVKRTTRLPASTLPNLSALYVDSMSLDYEVDAPMLVSTRPVTHFGWYGQRLPPDLILCLSVSAPHLRVLFLGQFHFMEGSVLAEIADFFPNLEGLARVDYKEVRTRHSLLRIFPSTRISPYYLEINLQRYLPFS
jgi:hypothetical protein